MLGTSHSDRAFTRNRLWWHYVDSDDLDDALHTDDTVDSDDTVDLGHVSDMFRKPWHTSIPDYIRDFVRDVRETYPGISENVAMTLWNLRSATQIHS